MATRRQTFRLYPSKAQEKALLEARRLHCYLYNACVSHRETEYKLHRRTVTYLEQQNLLPEFKQVWVEFAQLNSQALQATVKRVDYAYQRFFRGLSRKPRFKSIRRYSGWTYPARSGWKVNSTGKHGTVTLNDLGITLKMRGQAKHWGVPTTLTIVYKPSRRQWFAPFTVAVAIPEPEFGSQSDLLYESIVAYDLGTETALTLFDGAEFREITNPRFTQRSEEKIRRVARLKRRKRAPKKGVKASRRWKKIHRREAQLQAKAARQRKDWQHKVTSEIACRYDKALRAAIGERRNGEAACQRDDPQGWEAQGRAKQVHSVGGVRYIEPDDYLQNRAERWFSSRASYASPQALATLSQVRGSPQGVGGLEQPLSCLLGLWV
jgi:putative transposase